MIEFVISHPWLALGAAAWLSVAIFGWMFIAGAAIASVETSHPPRVISPEDERAAHRAAVDAGYASLAEYVEKYRSDK